MTTINANIVEVPDVIWARRFKMWEIRFRDRVFLQIPKSLFTGGAIVAITCFTIYAVLTIIIKADGGFAKNQAAILQILGFAAPTIAALLSLMKGQVVGAKLDKQDAKISEVQENAAQAKVKAAETAEKIDKIESATNGNLQRAIKTMAEEVRVAEREQLLCEFGTVGRLAEALRPMIQETAIEAAKAACSEFHKQQSKN